MWEKKDQNEIKKEKQIKKDTPTKKVRKEEGSEEGRERGNSSQKFNGRQIKIEKKIDVKNKMKSIERKWVND